MRAEDHTLVGYAIGWGTTIPQRALRARREGRRLEDQIFELEAEWKKTQGLHLMRRGRDVRTPVRIAPATSAPQLIIGVAVRLPWISTALAGCLASSACLVTQTTSGLIIGMLLFLVAVGLTLIFGVLKVVNFSHGAFYMFGAYFAMTTYPAHRQLRAGDAGRRGRRPRLVGLVFERVFMSRVYGQNVLMQLLVCYAFVLIFDDVVKHRLGAGIQVDGHAAGVPGAAAVHRRRRGAAVSICC